MSVGSPRSSNWERKLTIELVTSYGPGGWEQYAERFVITWKKFQQSGVALSIYRHDVTPPPGVPTKDLLLDPNFVLLRQKFVATQQKLAPQGDWRFDAVKFMHKVGAIIQAASTTQARYLCWIDADVEFVAPVRLDDLLCEGGISHLGRVAAPYSETSFLAFDLKSDAVRDFLLDLWNTYVSGEVFQHKEWHDGFIFERLLNLHRWHGLATKNLSPDAKTLDAFHSSPLAAFAKHYKGALKEQAPTSPFSLPINGEWQSIKVLPKDSVSHEALADNISTNIVNMRQKIGKFLKRVPRHDGKAFLLGSGPGLDRFIEQWKEGIEKYDYAHEAHPTMALYAQRHRKLGYDSRRDAIVCIKHALPKLMAAGIIPDFCIVLDPRDIAGESTHGVNRKSLFENTSQRTVFLVASMTHPSVIEELLAKNLKIVGWHATTDGLKENIAKFIGNDIIIGGGTCAAVRAIGVMQILGFRHVEIFGVDASRADEPTAEESLRKDGFGRPWWIKTKFFDGPERWTTGEMLALAQDIHSLAMGQMNPFVDLRIELHSELLAGDIWKTVPKWLDNWREIC